MVEDKTRHLLATGADTLVSADWGCLLNIKGSLAYQGKTLPAMHLASFLLAHSEPVAQCLQEPKQEAHHE
ncbi:Lactate utilization protein A [compost metagenome]